eukprot:CAMPEP_0114156268 /NCGR_PEP_ID=MMETSP0043_2-20121206/25957_1 /TAXON_ID=464988 /ORGANISM="Hemiselmis andersenii, Strain CCMP644" /LENGTH=430 /DNA_ID=CAMNT_0001251677 /DNA_START=27 /DNA_END=1316 /DNA_ORIENTATION=-
MAAVRHPPIISDPRPADPPRNRALCRGLSLLLPLCIATLPLSSYAFQPIIPPGLAPSSYRKGTAMLKMGPSSPRHPPRPRDADYLLLAHPPPALPAAAHRGALCAQQPGAAEVPRPRLPIKQIVLALLVMQNACQMLSMRYSRINISSIPYLASTAVVSSEVIKVGTCLIILLLQHKQKLPSILYQEVFVNWRMTLKVAVPAFVYMVQNNLLFIATSNLDAATCQITYQLKVLTTALFAVTMLGKRIRPVKWFALCLLVAGIALVQAPSFSNKAVAATSVGNPVLGFSAVVAACFLSGFAGIWFEKILKGSDTSIWIRNIQLGSIGSVGAIVAAYTKDGAAIASGGFFQGYSPLVWSVIGQVGLGGLLVALVVRYADNILKGFATSLSIVASGVLSTFLIPGLKFTPTPVWLAGTVLVLSATVLYSLPDS